MKRVCVAIIIGFASCALNGCAGTMGVSPSAGTIIIHPLSEITTPTICQYSRHIFRDPGDEPLPIMRLQVGDWELVYAPEHFDRPAWESKYAPPSTEIPVRPFSCITYGRAPPGYKENGPAPPLSVDKWHEVVIYKTAAVDIYRSSRRFIIRADSSGRPMRLEYGYRSGFGIFKRVDVIAEP